jgi:uncharacterized membrane protein YcfT
MVVPLAAALQMTAYVSPSYIVTQFCAYFVFFYLGYAAAPLVFRLVALAERHRRAAVAGLVVWALAEGLLVFSPGYALHPMDMQMGLAAWPPLHLALAVIGALALCVMGALLAELPWMDWLRWLGEHSLVVYVAFTIPMSIVRGILLWSGLVTDTGMLSLVVLVASTASPVILYLVVKRIGFGNFLFERPRWAHVPERRPDGAPEPLPAAE